MKSIGALCQKANPSVAYMQEFIDTARTMLSREACSAYVVERSAHTLIASGAVQLVPDAPEWMRPITRFIQLGRHIPMSSSSR